MDNEILDANEAAQFLRLSKGALYLAVARKQVPFIRFGGRLRFRRSALEAFLDSHQVPAEENPHEIERRRAS